MRYVTIQDKGNTEHILFYSQVGGCKRHGKCHLQPSMFIMVCFTCNTISIPTTPRSKSILFTLHLGEIQSVFAQIYTFYPTFGRKSFVLSKLLCIFAPKLLSIWKDWLSEYWIIFWWCWYMSRRKYCIYSISLYSWFQLWVHVLMHTDNINGTFEYALQIIFQGSQEKRIRCLCFNTHIQIAIFRLFVSWYRTENAQSLNPKITYDFGAVFPYCIYTVL